MLPPTLTPMLLWMLPRMAPPTPRPTTLATMQSEPYGIVVDSTDIYWAEPGVSSAPGAIVTIPIVGGTSTTLIAGQNYPELLALTPTTLYWTDNGSGSVMALTPK
jgi:hypothetical protein